MSRVIVGRGRTSATVEGPDAEEWEATIREALGEVVDVLEKAVDEVHADLKKTWPVFRKGSGEGWHKVLQVDPGTNSVRVALVNREPYVLLIKSTKHGKTRLATRSRNVFQTDVRAPMAAKKKAIMPELKDAITRAIQRGKNG